MPVPDNDLEDQLRELEEAPPTDNGLQPDDGDQSAADGHPVDEESRS
jgi:hypothetical protein